MRVEYINPFVSAAFSVLKSVLEVEPSKGSLAMRPSVCTTQQCSVVAGVSGTIEGHVVYGMSLILADRIASRMMGEPIRTFDHHAAGAIVELANMITGNALTELSQSGYTCEMIPPTIIRGTNVKISTLNVPAVVIPICLEAGEIELTVCLREKR